MSEFKVGDKVEWCGVEGEVIKIDDTNYPLEVSLLDGDYTFTLDGKYWDWHKEPSLKLIEKKTAYYIWRLWLKGGDIIDHSFFVSTDGHYPTGAACPHWIRALKREKRSEAVYKCEGQD